MSSPPPGCQKWYGSGYIGNNVMFTGFFEIPVTVTGLHCNRFVHRVLPLGDQPRRKPRNTPRTRKKQGTQRGRAATKNDLTTGWHRVHGWNSWKNWMRSSGQREERLAQQATEPKFFTEGNGGNEESEEKTGKRQPQRHRGHSAAEPQSKMI